MKIEENLILKLEHLTRLELTGEERQSLLTDLNAILKMVEKLQELETEEVEPLVYVTEPGFTRRNDEIRHQVSREEALKNAPDHNDSFFKVPKVIDL